MMNIKINVLYLLYLILLNYVAKLLFYLCIYKYIYIYIYIYIYMTAGMHVWLSWLIRQTHKQMVTGSSLVRTIN